MLKYLNQKNRKYTEKVKALISLSQNLKATLSYNEERVHSLENKLKSGSNTKNGEIKKSTTIKTLPKTKSEGNCKSTIIDTKNIKNATEVLLASVENEHDIMSAIESYVKQNGNTTTSQKNLLASWLHSQVDDITGDPTFQEETTKNAFARVEKI